MADKLLHKHGALRLVGLLHTSALAAVAYTRSGFSLRPAGKVKQRWTGFAGFEARGVGAVHRSIALSAGLATVLVGVRGSGRRAGGAVVRVVLLEAAVATRDGAWSVYGAGGTRKKSGAAVRVLPKH